MKISDMSLCEEYRYVCGVSCDCESANVKLLGTYERDEKGFFVDIKCLACQKTTQDGDGDFDDYFLITDGRINRREELIDMSEAISKKCAIARTINGISLNGYEFILEEDNETIKAFADKGVAVSYLKESGVTSEDIYYLRFLDYDKLTANNEYEEIEGSEVEEPVAISRWYRADIEEQLKQAGYESTSENVDRFLNSGGARRFLDHLASAGNEILADMMCQVDLLTEKVEEEFGDITFQEISERFAEGVYDKRNFTILVTEEETLVEGEFTDKERLFIFTQWGERQMKTYKVVSTYETFEEVSILNEKQMKELAEYYYDHSDETEVIDFNDLQNCIDFILRCDTVEQLE